MADDGGLWCRDQECGESRERRQLGHQGRVALVQGLRVREEEAENSKEAEMMLAPTLKML